MFSITYLGWNVIVLVLPAEAPIVLADTIDRIKPPSGSDDGITIVVTPPGGFKENGRDQLVSQETSGDKLFRAEETATLAFSRLSPRSALFNGEYM